MPGHDDHTTGGNIIHKAQAIEGEERHAAAGGQGIGGGESRLLAQQSVSSAIGAIAVRIAEHYIAGIP